ncbi:acyl-CoA dehydrogenase family protein [bacterium]|nr:acyl-CoA dehydrogenase family protein [bacterium]
MFELTKPQKEIQKAAKDFAKGEFDKELAYELEKNNEFPTSIWKKAAELGFIGIHFPEKYSGGEMGLFENSLIIEELCRNDPSIGVAVAQASFASECIEKFGSEELKASYLPRIAEGEILSGGAFSETQRGGDYKNIQTTAEKKGGQWVLNGRKTHVINGSQAEVYVVLCKTDQTSASIENNLSMILVDADSTGLSAEPYGKKLGENMVKTAVLTLDNVSVPENKLVGKEGKGYSQMLAFLDDSRIIAASMALGNALASFDRMLDYIKGREQFGKKLASFQVTQHKVADMATKIELSRLIIHKAAWLRDKKKSDSSLCSMAKMTAARTAMEVGAQTIQLYGGYGYMTEYEVERFYRDAKIIELRDGARDVQKDIVASAVIGKIK